MASPPETSSSRPLFDLNVADECPPESSPEAPAEKEEENPEKVVQEEDDPEEVMEVEEEVEVEVEEEVEEVEVEEVEVEVEEEEEDVQEPVERRKRKEYEVFVGGLPRDAVEEDVARAFDAAGEVVEVRLVRAHGERRLNKGFAFVRFAAVEQARKAASELRRALVKGKSCGIFKNNENETLHIRNICFDWTKDDLTARLKAFELENLEEIHLIEHSDKKGKNRGYAFLDFSTHMDAVAAFLKLQKRDVYLGTDFRAQVSFSKTISQDKEVMAQVKSVFLDGLPASWDEDKVREMFKKFGEIENIQLARNMFSPKRKDFGFISFTTRQSAVDCIKMVNKDGVGEGTEKVLMKATLQRPKPTFKKPSWKGALPVLGIKRGFIGKSYGGRGLHQSRFSHTFPERHAKSRNFAHKDYRLQPMVGRLPSMAVDAEEMSLSVREYRAYYRRDCAIPVSSSTYREAYPETRIREAYAERRYANAYPKRRHADIYQESMQRDAYRESRHRQAYLERAHRESCPECSSSDHDVAVYQNFPSAYSHSKSRYPNADIADHCYEYQNGEEFPAIHGCEQAYYKTGHELTPSTSHAISRCEESYCEIDHKLIPSSSPAMCECEQCRCNIDHELTPSTSKSERVRSRPNLQMPIHPRYLPDEHSAYEVEYTIREHRGCYLSARGCHKTHNRTYHRP